MERCIETTVEDGTSWYKWTAIEEALGVPFPRLLDQCPLKMVYRDKWIDKSSLTRLLGWIIPENRNQRAAIQAVKKALKTSRKVSRKFRWEVAYRQKYKCQVCQELLHPKAMDIDHVLALSKGGEDVIENLQALCTNCHAKKSRYFC